MILVMMRPRIGALWAAAAFLGLGPSAAGQLTSGVGSSAVVDRDIRVFTVTAALNAAGFDVDFAPQYHPVRQAVREQLEDLDTGLRDRLAAFYSEHRGDTAHEDELARYVSLALSLTFPPAMDLAVEGLFVPPDARDLTGFVPLLNEFYDAAGISRLWVRLAPAYDAVLDSMGGRLRQAVVQSEAYLRIPAGSTGGRRLVAFLELAAPTNSVHVRNYPENLYMVFGYTAETPIEEVRHAYLHLVLDPVVAANREELEDVDGMSDWLAGIDGVRPEYADDFGIMVRESLIRAVELRLDRDPDGVMARLDAAYRSGLLLTPYFMDRLSEFEQTPVGIREYFVDMALELDDGAERARFDDRFHAIEVAADPPPRAEVPAPPPSDPVRDLLLAGQEAFNSGDDPAARTAFETVLEELDPSNGPALYGMALLASREGDPDAARTYFRQTVESASAEPPMRAWSHVFLGRILDIECDREAALDEYRAAAAIGDETNGADRAAASAINEPFGGGCEF